MEKYDRFLQMWGICLLITILGQTIGIFAGVICGTQVFQWRIFYYFN